MSFSPARDWGQEGALSVDRCQSALDHNKGVGASVGEVQSSEGVLIICAPGAFGSIWELSCRCASVF